MARTSAINRELIRENALDMSSLATVRANSSLDRTFQGELDFGAVFLEGTLPKYGFCRCVAWALGVVVPSAGLIARGVAIEYPRGPPLCPQAVRLNASVSASAGVFDLVFTAIWPF
jgi:hypothetical protein